MISPPGTKRDDTGAAVGASFHHRKTLPALLLLLLLAALIRVPLLNLPLERDEGEYAYIAWRLGHHELPYRDWIDQKPPAIFWVYRLALNLPMGPVRSIHFMALLFSAASAGALFVLGRRFLDPPWPLVAAALFAVLSGHPLIQGTAANTEIFMLLPLILSHLAFFEAERDGRCRPWAMVLSGILTGIAMAFKQVAAVNWLFLVLICPLFVSREKRRQRTLSFAGLSAVGVAAVWGMLTGYFWLRHGLSEFIYNVFTHNLEYIHGIPWAVRLRFLILTSGGLAPVQGLVWLLAVIGLTHLWGSGKVRWLVYVAGWLVSSFAGTSASGYFFPHYFQQLLPPLAITAAAGARAIYGARIVDWISSWNRRILVALLLGLLPAWTLFPFLFVYSKDRAAAEIYPQNRHFALMPQVAKRIAEITTPNDRVFIFGAEPEVLFYARRVSATRYIFLFPLYGPYQDAHDKQVATAKEVSAAAPAALLYFPNELFFVPGTDQYFTHWTQSYIRNDFHGDTYFVADGPGVFHLVPADAMVPGQTGVVGGIFLKNAAPARALD